MYYAQNQLFISSLAVKMSFWAEDAQTTIHKLLKVKFRAGNNIPQETVRRLLSRGKYSNEVST